MQVFGYEIGFFYARRAETRSVSLSNPATASYFGFPTSSPAFAGTTDGILSIPPAWAAIRYISEGIAALGRGVYIRQSDGDVFPDHTSPVAQLFNGRPHPHYSTFDFLQALISNACLGDGYARIYRDLETMQPTALEIIPQEFVSVVYGRTGQLFYHVCGTMDEQTVDIYLPETDMLHIKGVTMTGVSGKKVRVVHRDTFGTSLAAQQYSKAYFERGAAVGGVVSFPNPLTLEQRELAKGKLAEQHQGARNAGSIMILDAGAQFSDIQHNPKDAAVIDFRNLATVEVSQLFKVPLHLLSQLDRSTFSNMEQQNQDFTTHCLLPWARKVEEEVSKLFTTREVQSRKRFFAFNLDAMMMGDMQAQAAFFSSAIQNGWMTPNEVRAKKNLNRIEGGDMLLIQTNMIPLDMLEDMVEAGINKKDQNGTVQKAQGAESAEDGENMPAQNGANDDT